METVGWFKPFITHELNYNAKASFPSTQTSTPNLTTQKHEYHDRSQLLRSANNIEVQRSKFNPNGPKPLTYYFDDSILKPIDGFHPGDPFLIVSVDQQIMHDHSDITNKVLINFIREYIQFCQVDLKRSFKITPGFTCLRPERASANRQGGFSLVRAMDDATADQP